MKDDPIVAEVRAAGEELAKQAGYDFDRFFDLIKERERKSGRTLVKSVRDVDYRSVPPAEVLSVAEGETRDRGGVVR